MEAPGAVHAAVARRRRPHPDAHARHRRRRYGARARRLPPPWPSSAGSGRTPAGPRVERLSVTASSRTPAPPPARSRPVGDRAARPATTSPTGAPGTSSSAASSRRSLPVLDRRGRRGWSPASPSAARTSPTPGSRRARDAGPPPAMNGSLLDSTFNFFFKLKYKLFDQMLATPLDDDGHACGELELVAAARGGIYPPGSLVVMVAMGLVVVVVGGAPQCPPRSSSARLGGILHGAGRPGYGPGRTSGGSTRRHPDVPVLPRRSSRSRLPPAVRWVVEVTPAHRGVVLCRETLTTGVVVGVRDQRGLPGRDGVWSGSPSCGAISLPCC